MTALVISGPLGAMFDLLPKLAELEMQTIRSASALKWAIKDTRDGYEARYQVCGIKATVIDCDGDGSEWWVKDKGATIAEGRDMADGHFCICLRQAEHALRSYVDTRKAGLKGRRPAEACRA